MTDRLHVRHAHGVALVEMVGRPMNVLTTALLAQFERVLARPSAGVRAIVLTGDTDFSYGADLGELGSMTAAALRRALARAHRLVARLERSPIPVIAAIRGRCLGGGLEIALACHVRIAGSGARLGFPEVTVGLVPGLGGTTRLPMVVGHGRAVELMLTGRSLRAADALAIGLVDHVVPDTTVVDAATRLARRMASKSDAAVAATLRCLRDGVAGESRRARRTVRTCFAALMDDVEVRRTLREMHARSIPSID